MLNARQSIARRFGFVTVVGAMMLGSALIAGTAGSSAHEGVAHPAHIHTGTCPAPADVVFPLNDVGGETAMNGSPITGDMLGAASAIPVDYSETSVQAPLADLLGSEHAIVVHESADNIGNYLVCGDLGGMVMGGTDLAVGLGELNESGYSGIAWLHDNGDGTTLVKVFTTESEGGMGDHDMATPGEGDASASGEVAVSIADFAFGDPIEVPVGTTVTWTNLDSAPHTVTQTGGGFQSGKLDEGATFSFTFDTPGTYEYFCEYHANMKGTITVK